MKYNQLRKFVAIVVVVILIVSSVLVWFVFFRPISLRELSLRHYDVGESVTIKGTVTDIYTLNTSHGPLTLLSLDGYYDDEYGYYYRVLTNEETYDINDTYQSSIEFVEYNFNGHTIITTKELFDTYLLLPTAMGVVLDAVAYVGGIYLNPISTGNGTTQYEVITNSGDQYPLNMINVSLRMENANISNTSIYDIYNNTGLYNPYEDQDIQLEPVDHRTFPILYAIEYVYGMTSYDDDYHHEIDFMDSLANGISDNGLVRYIDVNSNYLLDNSDIFELYIPPTPDEYTLESYFLQIGGDHSDDNIAMGNKYIINWHDGFFWIEDYSENSFNSVTAVQLSYESEVNDGTSIETSIIVTRVLGDVHPYDNYRYSLGIGTYDQRENYDDELSEGVMVINDSITMEYQDNNENDLLDDDDRFVIRGVDNQTKVHYSLFDETASSSTGFIQWIIGYGHVNGRLPEVELGNMGKVPGSVNDYEIRVNTSFVHPELSLDNTMFHVRKSRSYVTEQDMKSITNGHVGDFNGTNVTYFDVDHDSLISANDYFLIDAEPQSSYTAYITFFNEDLSNWLTFSTGELAPTQPITINSNLDFDTAHGVIGGEGTEVNPWIIVDYEINGTGQTHCIYIGNTTDHFTVTDCELHSGEHGLILNNVTNGNITGNEIMENSVGIQVNKSNTNSITNNKIEDNGLGIRLLSSNNNLICLNRFDDNSNHSFDDGDNIWNFSYDDGGGNHWDDYSGSDIYSGPLQDAQGMDNAGDTPYYIPGGNNTDIYPLINPQVSMPFEPVIRINIPPFDQEFIIGERDTIDVAGSVVSTSNLAIGIPGIPLTVEIIETGVTQETITGVGGTYYVVFPVPLEEGNYTLRVFMNNDPHHDNAVVFKVVKPSSPVLTSTTISYMCVTIIVILALVVLIGVYRKRRREPPIFEH